MHYAGNANNLDVVKYLIEKLKWDPLIQSDTGLNTIHYAGLVYNGLEVIKYLLNY